MRNQTLSSEILESSTKRHSPIITAVACFAMSAAPMTIVNASDSLSYKTVSQASSDMEYILSELSRQHDNASTLIKSARKPSSPLALDSSLLDMDHQIDTDSLLASQDNEEEDVLKRLTAVASNSVPSFTQSGIASWYGEQFHGRTTASGERFNMNALTAAHPSLPFNSYVKVTNQDNGESVVVKVNDRGPFNSDRMLDLSYAAADQIGLTEDGIGNVTIERVNAP